IFRVHFWDFVIFKVHSGETSNGAHSSIRLRVQRGAMARFEYMICTSQSMRITFVNGRWQGDIAPETPGALDSCPDLWEFLQRVGSSGWELITVTTDHLDSEGEALTTLYLKRAKP
ncbi:MAG TPA: hypothetical protein VGD99_18325, partial [Anaerolineae bacterium]